MANNAEIPDTNPETEHIVCDTLIDYYRRYPEYLDPSEIEAHPEINPYLTRQEADQVRAFRNQINAVESGRLVLALETE